MEIKNWLFLSVLFLSVPSFAARTSPQELDSSEAVGSVNENINSLARKILTHQHDGSDGSTELPISAYPGFSVGTFTSSASTGTQSVTGIGFKPRFLILTFCRGNATSGGYFEASLGFGTSASSQVAAIQVHSDPAASNAAAETSGYILTAVTASAYSQKVKLVSMDDDGFTINNEITSGFTFTYVAIE